LPGTEWKPDHDPLSALAAQPMPLAWTVANEAVRHVFTHFPLELAVFAARVPAGATAPEGMRFTPLAQLDEEPLPTLMRKAIDVGLRALGATRGRQ
jgi:A/G-specific adenine glycosylase